MALIGLGAALVAAAAAAGLVRPVVGFRLIPPVLSWLAGGASTLGVGAWLGVASFDYLMGVCAFALPMLVLLAAATAGPGGAVRWLPLLTWAVLVFPVATVVPLALTSGCAAPECGFEDFGAALPLFVSSSAFALVAAGGGAPGPSPHHRRRGTILLALVLWSAFTVWLVSLEGVVDAYTVRILVAVSVAAAAAIAGWGFVVLLRGATASPESLVVGPLSVGAVAIASGAATVVFPWTALVAILAGALAALLHSTGPAGRRGAARRWAGMLLVASAAGFLAPPVSGDAIGVLFSARFGILPVPVLALLGVLAWAAMVAVPVRLATRARARDARRPAR